MQIEHLRAVRQARLRYASAKRSVKLATGYGDYRAILHAHAEDSIAHGRHATGIIGRSPSRGREDHHAHRPRAA